MSDLVQIAPSVAEAVRATAKPTQDRASSMRLVGIARMAAESPQVRARADTEYFALESRSVLNRESSGRLPFAWTINPYRGCEFGCKYCYARYSHEFMELRDGLDFERKIFAKVNAPELLRAELRRARDKGLPLLDEKPRRGLAGMICFLHPRATRGVLVEYAQPLEE